jgi:hypothetical protein
MPFHAKSAIALPRQARDRHRENSRRDAFFLQCASCEMAFCTLCREVFHPGMQVRKRSFLAISIYKCSFYQDRLGENIGKTQRAVFLQCMDPEEQLKVLGERARGNKNAGKEERARHERYNISLSLCLSASCKLQHTHRTALADSKQVSSAAVVWFKT